MKRIIIRIEAMDDESVEEASIIREIHKNGTWSREDIRDVSSEQNSEVVLNVSGDTERIVITARGGGQVGIEDNRDIVYDPIQGAAVVRSRQQNPNPYRADVAVPRQDVEPTDEQKKQAQQDNARLQQAAERQKAVDVENKVPGAEERTVKAPTDPQRDRNKKDATNFSVGRPGVNDPGAGQTQNKPNIESSAAVSNEKKEVKR